jgi:hypothetical protein
LEYGGDEALSVEVVRLGVRRWSKVEGVVKGVA